MAAIDELIKYLSEGLDPDQTKALETSLRNEKVAARAAGLKQEKEFADIQKRATELQAKLEGADGKPGAATYEKWYADNYPKIQKMQADQAAFIEKYGALESPKQQEQQMTGLTPEQIQELVNKQVETRIQTGYAPKWSELLTGTGTIVQKHMFAGRKTPIDFNKLSEIAAKYNGNLEQAYDEWDKPEREKEAAANTEKEIARRVTEEVQKRGADKYFPSGADATPSVLSRSRSGEKFDEVKMNQDLVKTFVTGVDTPVN